MNAALYTLVWYVGGELFTKKNATALRHEFGVVVSSKDVSEDDILLPGETQSDQKRRKASELRIRKEVLLVLNGVFMPSSSEVKQRILRAFPNSKVRLEIVNEEDVPGNFFFIGDHSVW